MAAARGSRQPRNIEKAKKKAASAIPRAKLTRNQGNTSKGRVTAKRAATKARADKAKPVAAAKA